MRLITISGTVNEQPPICGWTQGISMLDGYAQSISCTLEASGVLGSALSDALGLLPSSVSWPSKRAVASSCSLTNRTFQNERDGACLTGKTDEITMIEARNPHCKCPTWAVNVRHTWSSKTKSWPISSCTVRILESISAAVFK